MCVTNNLLTWPRTQATMSICPKLSQPAPRSLWGLQAQNLLCVFFSSVYVPSFEGSERILIQEAVGHLIRSPRSFWVSAILVACAPSSQFGPSTRLDVSFPRIGHSQATINLLVISKKCGNEPRGPPIPYLSHQQEKWKKLTNGHVGLQSLISKLEF